MQIAFRTDASRNIGLGHVQRCLALAHALRELGVDVSFVTRRLDADAEARIDSAGFAVHELGAPRGGVTIERAPPHAPWACVPWTEDVADTVAALRDVSLDWLVVDHYAFDARWHRAASSALGTRIAIIDDLADRPLDARLLIDHNLATPDHRSKYQGLITSETSLLGGPRFALLGPAYATATRYAFSEAVRSIGIFMGGTDSANLSATALIACREHARFAGPIEVVTTRANRRSGELEALAARWPHTRVTLDLPDLAAFFAQHDLHIGAGGGATWERCCIGAPALVLVAANNQHLVVPTLAEIGAAATPSEAEGTTIDGVGRNVGNLITRPETRRALSERARGLVDGRGASRVALRLASRLLKVRPATSADSSMMHGWRDHPATRAVSRGPAPIAVTEHARWLERTLTDSRRALLVGHVGDVDVGVIRFDSLDDGATEVSLYIDPELHSLGLGGALLRAGETHMRQLASHRFVATVLPGNNSSCRLFASAGYRFEKARWEKKANRLTAATDFIHSP